MAKYKEKTGYQRKLAHPDWQRKRLEVLSRDSFTCQTCGSKDRELHVHHKYYLPGTDPQSYPLNAYETLCFECHEQEEEGLKSGSERLIQAMRVSGADSFVISFLADFFNKIIKSEVNNYTPYFYVEMLHTLLACESYKPGYIDDIDTASIEFRDNEYKKYRESNANDPNLPPF